MIIDDSLNKRQNIWLYLLVMIISGIMGFVYEEIFYLFDLGYLVKRGSTYGPWIPIYLFGGLFLTLIVYRFRKKPIIVFLMSLLVTGLLEFLTGFVLLKCFNLRLWDYNNEILNFGNIGGFICLRSVLLFAFAGLFLVYFVIPLLIKLIKKANQKILEIISYGLIVLFVLDMVIYAIVNYL
jgi:uncharacterized membrane protein